MTAPRRAKRLGATAALLALGLLGSEGLPAQTPPRLVDPGLSADTIVIGDRFDLTLNLSLPDDAVAFLPDSLTGPGFEPLGPVEWSAETSTDGTRLVVTYPLIAFDVGTVVVPDFEVFVGRAEESVSAGLSSTGAAVGSWSDFREAPARLPSASLLEVPRQEVWVASVLTLDEETQTIAPRPAADVSGGDRNWPATLLMVLFGLTLTGVMTTSAREAWMNAGRGRVAPPGPRARALAALDALHAEGACDAENVRAFYGRSSDIVREYVEGFDPRWNRAWTSTELMSGLMRTRGSDASRVLSEEIGRAEAVKFGGVRPAPEEAERFWGSLRQWVAAGPVDASDAG